MRVGGTCSGGLEVSGILVPFRVAVHMFVVRLLSCCACLPAQLHFKLPPSPLQWYRGDCKNCWQGEEYTGNIDDKVAGGRSSQMVCMHIT